MYTALFAAVPINFIDCYFYIITTIDLLGGLSKPSGRSWFPVCTIVNHSCVVCLTSENSFVITAIPDYFVIIISNIPAVQ
jgi:hypothetical protein